MTKVSAPVLRTSSFRHSSLGSFVPLAASRLPSPPLLRMFGPMQSHELLREVFQQTSPKQVSSDLGLSLSLIYKWAEPPDNAAGSGSSNPLDRIDALLRSTNDVRLVQWLCERAGGFFIRNPKTHNPHPDFLIPATNEIIQEFADLLAVIASAAADSNISTEEARKIRARWEELKGVTETFVRCCEEGNFRLLMVQPPPWIPAPKE